MIRAVSLLSVLGILTASPAIGQSLQDKIGQMLIVGLPNGDEPKDTLIADITDRNIGGVLMFAYNISSPEQIRLLNGELQSLRMDPLMIAVDQEGGIVARLDEQNGYSETHTAESLGETFRSENVTRAQARVMAQWLSDAGFNVNFAPVVDVKVDPLSPAIARLERSFSSDEQTVVDHATWFIDEFHRQHIATSLKHFPGHGSARADSHFGFTDISDTWQERELYPFRELIGGGYSDMVMTGHLFKRDWDSQYPVSLSRPAITGVLRDELGFKGVVISDEFFMKAIQDHYGFDEAVVQAINAGTDILLFNTNMYKEQSLSRYVIDLVYGKVASGEIDPGSIDAAYDRIQRLKRDRIATGSDVPLPHDPSTSPAVVIGSYPNPFAAETTIELLLPIGQHVRVDVYDAIGRHIKTIADSHFSSGTHRIPVDGSLLASGVYLVRAAGNAVHATHRMVRAR